MRLNGLYAAASRKSSLGMLNSIRFSLMKTEAQLGGAYNNAPPNCTNLLA
jgi:hypothetical protein